ncbi:MAG: vWA domain-containing protein [Myxococcota bacterium]
MVRVSAALLLLVACADGGGSGIRADIGVGGDTATRSDERIEEDERVPPEVGTGGDDGICDNGLDDDGDDRVDEGCACTLGSRQNCFVGDPALAGEGACFFGFQRCEGDGDINVWGECEGSGAPESEEVCDRVDNNCDGVIDEGCGCTPGVIRDCYAGPDGTLGVGICLNGFQRCLDLGAGGEWSGCEASITPEDEDCDGGDDECDGLIDEGCTCSGGETRDCYGGPPGTRGEGECRSGRQRCDGAGWGECTGDVVPVEEVCSGGDDEDCDGLVDCADDDCDCCTTFNESVSVSPAEAELFFIVDRSGSMNFPAVGTTRTRWEELEEAMAAVLPTVTDTPLGLLTFPEQDGSDERLNCAVGSGPDLAVGADAGRLQSALAAATPRAGDTPTPDAFRTAQAYLDGRSTSRETFVVLATDGLPEPNCDATVPATVSAIENLRSATGIDTFVIGVVGPSRDGDTSGIPALRDALNQFATAGGRPRSASRRYYEAVDGAELTSALRAILGEATECRFELGSTPPAGAVVFQNGDPVPASGYSLSGRNIEFRGTFCDRIRSGLVTSISVRVDC